MTKGLESMPYDLVDHPGQIQLFNVLHLFFTTVCSSQLIVTSAKDFLENGMISALLLPEESAKEQILAWLQFVAGKRSKNDISDVFFVCTFYEADRQDIAGAKVGLSGFLKWVKNDLKDRFPNINLPQDEPVGRSLSCVVLCEQYRG